MSSSESVKKKWAKIIKNILEKGDKFGDRRTRICYELLNQTYTFTSDQFKTIKEPIQFLSTFNEWIYPDIDEIKQIILETAQSPHYEYSYANRLFSYNNNVNQMKHYIIPELKRAPNTRRAIMSFLNPLTDDQNPDLTERPALTSIQFLYRNNQLHLTAYIRSCDIFFGFPANLLQLHALLTHVAQESHHSVGNITLFCASAHVFDDQKPYINKLISLK